MIVPSEADRAKADAIVSRWSYKGDAYFDRAVRDIAQALADERAQARHQPKDELGTPHVCQFCETPLRDHWWDPCTYTPPLREQETQ